jgi:hypothetical protein
VITLINAQGKEISLDEDYILKVASSLDCGCPAHLLTLIQSTKDLQQYEAECIASNPKGFTIHSWLLAESAKLEKTITLLLTELLIKENILDEKMLLDKKV